MTNRPESSQDEVVGVFKNFIREFDRWQLLVIVPWAIAMALVIGLYFRE